MGKIIFNKAALAGKEASELQAQIELRSKDISISQVTVVTLDKQALWVRDKLAGLKNLMEQGPIYERDKKSVELEVRNLSSELVEKEQKQKEAVKVLEKAQSELEELKKEFAEKYVVIEIAEPVKRESQFHNAVYTNLAKS